jgi:hypothetical protein
VANDYNYLGQRIDALVTLLCANEKCVENCPACLFQCLIRLAIGKPGALLELVEFLTEVELKVWLYPELLRLVNDLHNKSDKINTSPLSPEDDRDAFKKYFQREKSMIYQPLSPEIATLTPVELVTIVRDSPTTEVDATTQRELALLAKEPGDKSSNNKYAVPVWEPKTGRRWESVWSFICEFDLRAQRSHVYRAIKQGTPMGDGRLICYVKGHGPPDPVPMPLPPPPAQPPVSDSAPLQVEAARDIVARLEHKIDTEIRDIEGVSSRIATKVKTKRRPGRGHLPAVGPAPERAAGYICNSCGADGKNNTERCVKCGATAWEAIKAGLAPGALATSYKELI